MGHLPIKSIAAHPEVAFEEFRATIGHLRQIIAAGDRDTVSQIFAQEGRATALEKAIWEQMNRG